MLKKFRKTDVIFLFAIFTISIIHISCIFSFPGTDESFYPSVALRLFNGDSLISDEWHLTQFASLFSFLPVAFWLKITGSAKGLIVFIRAVYLLIHTASAFAIYKSFRKYGAVSVLAGAVFYLHVPYAIATISYISVYALASVFLTVLLLKIYENPKKRFFIGVGFCYGCCCVCNPLFCLTFPLYLFICGLYNIVKYKCKSKDQKTEKQHSYAVFFSFRSILLFFAGICVIAGICIIYYFMTGGTLASIPDNLKMMLEYSEYLGSFFDKLKDILSAFKDMSFNLPFLMPLLFILVLFDKNRRKNAHTVFYLLFALILAVLFFARMVMLSVAYSILYSHEILAVLLPCVLFSTVCYILTENKNKAMFNCMYLPGLFCALFQFFVSRMIFATLGWALIPCAIAGIFFIGDFCKEKKAGVIRAGRKNKKVLHSTGKFYRLIIVLVAVCCCVQFFGVTILYYTCHYEDYFLSDLELAKQHYISEGPAAGTFLPETSYNKHMKVIRDIDKIKEQRLNDAPVLLLTNEPWTYLHLESGFATYTTWHQFITIDALENYFKLNSEKTPAYIYVSNDYYSVALEIRINQLFDSKKTNLESGFLFTIDQ